MNVFATKVATLVFPNKIVSLGANVFVFDVSRVFLRLLSTASRRASGLAKAIIIENGDWISQATGLQFARVFP